MGKLFQKLNKLKAFRGLNEREFAWVLYDVGNSAFIMLACSLIPIWFKSLAEGHITGDQATAYYSIAISVVTLAVAVLGPIFGALADRKGHKILFFRAAVAVGTIGCVLTGFSLNWLLFLVLYVVAKISFAASVSFYDSMLNDTTTEDRMDEVSSYGYAWGYIGSCIPFTLALIIYILGPDMLQLIPDPLPQILGCIITAAWWLIVSLPLMKTYRQENYVKTNYTTVGDVFRKIGRTLKDIALRDKKVLYFLIAFFLYIDGVDTIIDNCINVGTDLGLPTVGQVVFLLATQVVAWVGSLVFARLSKKHDTAKLLLVCIVGYFCVCLYALTLKTLIGFGILAFGVGCFQGSIQSLSRSYYSKIIPPENSSEYFGIYDIFCKGASFLGSAVIAAVKLAGGSINIAVASLATFFFFGFFFLKLADKQPSGN